MINLILEIVQLYPPLSHHYFMSIHKFDAEQPAMLDLGRVQPKGSKKKPPPNTGRDLTSMLSLGNHFLR